MPELKYVGHSEAVILDGVVCKRGDIVVFPQHITVRALEQDCWEETPKTSSSPTIIGKTTKEIA